mgnify:CR=1 FL=1
MPYKKIQPSLSVATDELFQLKLDGFMKWIDSVQADGPCEIVITVAPFDGIPYAWDIRPFSSYELENMSDCVRLRVDCTDLFREQVEETVFQVAEPPSDERNWQMGVYTLLSIMPFAIAEAQSEYLCRFFNKYGFDSEKFLSETDGVIPSDSQILFLESKACLLVMNDLLADPATWDSPDQWEGGNIVRNTLTKVVDNRYAAFYDKVNSVKNSGNN